MSERLREIAERLGAIARELEGEGDDARAAELSAEAVEEANRRARESGG